MKGGVSGDDRIHRSQYDQMKSGAVAILDVLGFKGIWHRYDADEVLGRLEQLRRDLEVEEPKISHKLMEESQLVIDRQLGGKKGPDWIPCTVRFLSDSIFVASSLTIFEPKSTVGLEEVAVALKRYLDVMAILRVASTVSAIIQLGVEGQPRFAYRGCLSFGEFEDVDKFIVGPAVDEAAELERLAEGAIVWLSPSAHLVVETATTASDLSDARTASFKNMADLFVRGSLIKYEVPLKDLPPYETFTVDPFDGVENEDRQHIATAILSTFGSASQGSSTLSVETKRQITRRYLAHASTYFPSKEATT